jgi:hypothetical protein
MLSVWLEGGVLPPPLGGVVSVHTWPWHVVHEGAPVVVSPSKAGP